MFQSTAQIVTRLVEEPFTLCLLCVCLVIIICLWVFVVCFRWRFAAEAIALVKSLAHGTHIPYPLSHPLTPSYILTSPHKWQRYYRTRICVFSVCDVHILTVCDIHVQCM